MFLLNVSFIANKTISNFEFLLCHVSTWFNGHLVLWVTPLHLPTLGATDDAEEEILRFKFFMWIHKTVTTLSDQLVTV